MGTPDKKTPDLVDVVKSWIPRRVEPSNVSRDFWMPDQSCRVCYECDSQFTILNRRHHCRICGRVFCAKCTANSVPAPSHEPNSAREDWERIRVCNYCFKQWEQGLATVNNGTLSPTPCLSPSPSATSLVSSKSSCTCHSSSSTVGSASYSTGPHHRVPYSPHQSSKMDLIMDEQENLKSERSANPSEVLGDLGSNQFGYFFNRSDDEDDDYGVYHSDTESRHYSHVNDYHDPGNIHEIDHVYGPHEMHPDGDNIQTKDLSCLTPSTNLDLEGVDVIQEPGKEVDEHDHVDGCEATPYNEVSNSAEPVDFEDNGLLWLPPEPEDEEDEREADLFDDEDEGTTGEWGYLQSSPNFGSVEYRSRDKSNEEHRNAMKNVVEGHFRALVAQLLQAENLTICDEDDKESWLNIITTLSWEAATLLKPDMSRGGGMDPGGYVKVKCIASGHRNESMVVKGVVCKKNVAHRRMTSKIDKPRFLILGGALEYQRVSNQLSSVDTLLQQEMDHLKMAVAKIDAHHPNVLLVEKSVSRYAQEYLLAKDISLVLNIKKPLLERIARCTGAQIVPSIDHMTSQKLGYCDTFHVDKFFEEHGSAGQCGKKSTKTLMYFDGCPKPLGCTILLKGASGDELKVVKHVVQYGVFAAYHLALETSFLADEGASPLEFPLKSPITVALPDKPSGIERSISTISGFSTLSAKENQGVEPINEVPKSTFEHKTEKPPSSFSDSIEKSLVGDSIHTHEVAGDATQPTQNIPFSLSNGLLLNNASKEDDKKFPNDLFQDRQDNRREAILKNISDSFGTLKPLGQVGNDQIRAITLAAIQGGNLEPVDGKHDTTNNNYDDSIHPKEDFPPSTPDHQSILVFLSTRCVWKGTVCDRSHLVRIKYYGSSDKPLGRFLRDQLLDPGYTCHSCEMPSEAHVHCYTHRQGSLTISVKKILESPLPGEREGKIWMWHRCLKCPRVNGFPSATRRVVMSDAAWGLSFGKFLELSFSNHAAASRVASCGHLLHRDCLRFYGFGKIVACFRYASIDLNSVHLPPPKLAFNYDSQDWLQKEAVQVQNSAEVLFNGVHNTLHHMSENVSGHEGGNKVSDFRDLVIELKEMQQKEKEEFEDLLQKLLHKEVKSGKPVVDILEINILRRHILLHSYVWDQRLIYVSNQSKIIFQEDSRNSYQREKSIGSREKVLEEDVAARPVRSHSTSDSYVSETKPDGSHHPENASHLSLTGEVIKGGDKGKDTNHENVDLSLSGGANVDDKSDSSELGGAVHRALSEGEFPNVASLSDTLDAAWTGESHPINLSHKENGPLSPDAAVMVLSPAANLGTAKPNSDTYTDNIGGTETGSNDSKLFSKGLDTTRWTGLPYANLFSSFIKTFALNTQKLVEYNPVHISSFRELERHTGARLLLPAGINDTVVPIYDDEPTSIIAHVLMSTDYHNQMSESDRPKDSIESSVSLPLFDSTSLLSLGSFDESIAGTYRSFGSSDESMLSTSGSWSSLVGDPLSYTKDFHARVSLTDDSSSLGKVKYTVTCYYAKRFETLRKTCCPSELDFVRSLSRCKKWVAQGGKSNVFFAKTLDDRFIIKQVTKTELESFIKFAPAYFKYLSDSISTGSPTSLAKILGIYQVTSKHAKGGKEIKMDVLVMENLLYRRNIRRLYDLKGSSRSRYNPDTSGSNKVLLDQNLIESMPTSPIFVGNKAKRLLERAVWNDTAFLASIYVMDYSLLVGVDEENHELVLGTIDFMRQYTWDKHLETWVKTSGILGGPKNTTPTVISPQQYKKRFRKAMSAYFLMVPDQWSTPGLQPSGSQSDLCDENS